MSQDTSSAVSNGSAAYRMSPSAIPPEVRQKVAGTLGHDANVYPARNDSQHGYKGPVIHADKDFLVQAVGKGQKTAIIHQRSDLQIEGAKLQQRDSNNDLVNRNIQVHYRGEKGKVYAWNKDNEQTKPASKDLPAGEKLMNAAAEYAQGAFRTTKQREAFMAHIGNVTKEAFKSKDADKPAKAAERPVQQRDRQHTASIER